MTLPVFTTTFVLISIVVLILSLIVLVYAKTLILVFLIVLGVFYLKYKREQRLGRVPQ